MTQAGSTAPNHDASLQRRPATPKRPRHERIPPEKENIPLKNRFSVLSDDSGEEDDETESTANKKRKMTATTPKTRVPPIVVTAEFTEKETVEFIQRIKFITQGKEYRMAYSNNVYKIFCNDVEIYNILKQGVKQIQEEYVKKGKVLGFHTHQLPDQKLKHIVAKGLPNIDPEEIKNELLEKGLKCVRCSIMKTKNYVAHRPLYLMTFDSEVDMKEVWKIKHVYSLRVFWDRYKNPRKITQCHKCQQFGHGSSNCYNEARCLHCAAKHETKTCTTKGATPKCTNCGKEHRANSLECYEYTKRLHALVASKQQRKARPTLATPGSAHTHQAVPTLHEFPLPPWAAKEMSTETSAASRTTSTTGEQTAWRGMSSTTRNENVVGIERTWHAVNEFAEIFKVVERIHQICDVGKIFRKLQFLLSKLEHCANESDQLTAFLECVNNEP
ncbi:hypothetical protein QAD02_009264 [Eretmocerus hayati]|uniref:Uncharacterized protein n=1 Tax=Eretmocerus hayati TaxID=131215 RepID=A0ACC2NA79_9HYME|nr:hypothetical protein QAD02_009264 [Eretmocerus hayati]